MTRRPSTRRREAPAPESRLLVVVATISLGVGMLAFVLGMRFGLGHNDREPTGAVDAGGALQRLDRQATALRDVRTREQAALSFHESLTGPAKPAVALKRDGKPLTATSSPVAGPVGERARPKIEPKVETKFEPNKVEPNKVEPNKLEPEAVSAAASHLPPPPIVSAPEASGARFSLQAGAFPDEMAAKALSTRLTAKGFQVRIVPVQVEGKGTWHRVRVGSYSDRAAADSDRGKLSGEGVFAIVVPEN